MSGLLRVVADFLFDEPRYQFAGYTTTYQYSGVSMSDDGFFGGMSPCEVGTDCTDCGVKVGRQSVVAEASRAAKYYIRFEVRTHIEGRHIFGDDDCCR